MKKGRRNKDVLMLIKMVGGNSCKVITKKTKRKTKQKSKKEKKQKEKLLRTIRSTPR